MTKVLVTGRNGFFGRHIEATLQKRGYSVCEYNQNFYDLRYESEASRLIAKSHYEGVEYVIHAAAYSGGIVFNREHPYEIYDKNVRISRNILHACGESGLIYKVVSIVSSCAAADKGSDVLVEENFWDGLPNKSIRYFGLQKRNIAAASMALYEKHLKPFVWPVINNMFGPGDSTDLVKTKVVMALIHKFSKARKEKAGKVVCLGTGAPLRQFTYVEDAANAVVDVLEKYDDSFNPLYITTPEETSIKTLAETVAELVGYDGVIEWDISCSDGQMRKAMSGEKADKILGERQWTSLRDGLAQTIEWYRKTQ